jgi:hypothetical protein
VHGFVKTLIFACLAVIAVSLWRKDALPPPEAMDPALAEAPRQTETADAPFSVAVNGVSYRVAPRYAYELTGLVVSLHDSDTWWDYAHAEWSDHVNVVDFCVVWGNNALSGVYRGLSIKNDQWTCHFSTHSSEVWSAFDMTAASNNHMVTADAAVARAMRKVRAGDQVRFRGYLADYTTTRADGRVMGTRKTSTVRDDTGNGACEVVYVKSFDVIKPVSRLWATLGKVAAFVLLLAVIGWFVLPHRVHD